MVCVPEPPRFVFPQPLFTLIIVSHLWKRWLFWLFWFFLTIFYKIFDNSQSTSNELMFQNCFCREFFICNCKVALGLLENALSNTLQFIKQESTNDSYTSEEKREMKKDAVEFRNLQAKLAHFLKGVVSVK